MDWRNWRSTQAPPLDQEVGEENPHEAHRDFGHIDSTCLDKVSMLNWFGVRTHILPMFWYMHGFWLIACGSRWILTGTGLTAQKDTFKSAETFVRLRVQCSALSVSREAKEESFPVTGLDGIQHEVLFCVDTYRYNISFGHDRTKNTPGLERVRRSEGTCEASADVGERRHM